MPNSVQIYLKCNKGKISSFPARLGAIRSSEDDKENIETLATQNTLKKFKQTEVIKQHDKEGTE